MLIPSIDLYNGQAVQWRQGKEKVIARDDIFELLEKFSLYGEIALIDLNAALNQGNNTELIKKILQKIPCRVGGGIRNKQIAIDYLKSGATKIIIGTAAKENWVSELNKESIIIAIDAENDELCNNGWTHKTGENVLDVMENLSYKCSEFLYTQILKEGMLQGIDRERISKIIYNSSVPLTIAGGISTQDDINFINQQGANCQIGMAIYTNFLSLDDAFIANLSFNKKDLIPTIVQDIDTKEVLMLAYSNEISLRMAFQSRKGVYWSRSRNKLWIKGESSNNFQKLIRADFDCDGDSLIFQVQQVNKACHLERWSCFSSQRNQFSLSSLEKIIENKINELNLNSFTSKLFLDKNLRFEKLREETEELIEAVHYEHVRWESADLLYFLLVDAKSKGVSYKDIVNELRARTK